MNEFSSCPRGLCTGIYSYGDRAQTTPYLGETREVEVEDVKKIKNYDVNKAKGQQTPIQSQIHNIITQTVL